MLHDFELLHRLRVTQKYLFIYNGCKVITFKNYFYSPHVPTYGREEGELLYDHDNYDALPDAIVSISPDYYLGKGHCQDADHDMKGYIAYSLKDYTSNNIVSIQKFVEQLDELVAIPQKDERDAFLFLRDNENSQDDDLKTMAVEYGFGLFDI